MRKTLLHGSGLAPPVLTGQLTSWWATDLAATLANADPVSTWTDRVGSVSITGTTTTRPAFRSSHIGGRPAVDFDGTDDRLVLATVNPITSGTAGCITAVVLIDTATGGRGVWSTADDASSSRYIVGTASFSAAAGKIGIETGFVTLEAQLHGNTSLSTATPYLLEWSSDGSDYFFRVNGVVQTITTLAGTNTGTWFNMGTRDLFALGGLRFGASSFVAAFDGAIAHFQQLSSQLSSGDRAKYHSWVSSYYGIAL